MGVVLGQNMDQIRFNVVKKVKKQTISLGFFHILFGEYFLKEKVVFGKPPEWKCKTIIARNTKFKGHQNFCSIQVKSGKKLIIFNNFILVSQS